MAMCGFSAWSSRIAHLRRVGLQVVRPGPFGETLDTFASRAFAVCDHQLAHVYVQNADDLERTREALATLPGVARVVGGERARASCSSITRAPAS